jgi:NAD(P)-dependent dehydrogenase (short-subunit alcohol dehydrogenase family)
MNLLITGASKGLGMAYAKHLGKSGDFLYLVSRTRPDSLDLQDGIKRHWFEADLTDPSVHSQIAAQIPVLDAVIHNAGTWESTAFSRDYEFSSVPEAETRTIIELNLIAPILLTQALLPQLKASKNPKIILIGSINGLENAGMPEVAYNASKFGLRGIAHSLREHLRSERIGVSILNPGAIGWEGAVAQDFLIPPADIVLLTRTILEMSRFSVVKEVDLPAMHDQPV